MRQAIRGIVSQDRNVIAKRLKALSRRHPERPVLRKQLEKIDALLAEIDQDIAAVSPSRKDILADLRATHGVTMKAVACKAWPSLHPAQALSRIRKWCWPSAKYPRYADGSQCDSDVRWAIRSFHQ